MKKKKSFLKACLFFIFYILLLTGCSGGKEEVQENEKETVVTQSEKQGEEVKEEGGNEAAKIEEPQIKEVDWSDEFDGLNGAAVFYTPSKKEYQIYNMDLANTRRSPCSTFKIISSLIALDEGILSPEDSTKTWSGEIFWNEDWNRDIDFTDAFHTSCVWYFRQLIDEIGKESIQSALDELQYGNCDISDWKGELNTNNNNPSLTGFWIESSLKISPKEQVEVMERIFGEESEYHEETVKNLQKVLKIDRQEESQRQIYGKTGLGKADGITVDAWFTGFVDNMGENTYFCVYLGETPRREVSSTDAKELAISLIEEKF